MKQWLKKWWFSIFCFLSSVFVIVYCLVMLFIGDIDTQIKITMMIVSLTCSLTMICIGVINQPRKENTNE